AIKDYPVHWQTNGDGVFSSPDQAQTSYLPGPNDLTHCSLEFYFGADAPDCIHFPRQDTVRYFFVPTTPSIQNAGHSALDTFYFVISGTSGLPYQVTHSGAGVLLVDTVNHTAKYAPTEQE